MSDINDLLLSALALVLVAFVPSLIYMRYVRNIERYEREPWKRMGSVFAWGALTGIVLAALLSFAVLGLYEIFYTLRDGLPPPNILIGAVIVAPIVEEAVKGYGVTMAGRDIDEVEDGLVYGAACGLGFAATENLLYMAGALADSGGSLTAALGLGLTRAFSSTLLHASACALTGYGISRRRMLGPHYGVFPWYLRAVLLHAAFNFFATTGSYYGLFAAILLAIGSFDYVRRKIHALDVRAAEMY